MSSPSKMTLELSEKKRAILEALLREQGIGEAKDERIPRRTESGPAALSFAQQRLWFLDQLEPESPLYNIHVAVNLSGPLNVPVLQRSMGEILRRHEALRTTFAVIDDRPVQLINKTAVFKLPVSDLQELDESERWLRMSAWAEAEARRRFDLTKGPLLRANLLRLSETEHVLLLTIHHIVSDGWSMGVFVRELAALYKAYMAGRPSPLPDLPIQYADFAAWQRGWLQGERLEEQLSYWRTQLADAPPLLKLPTDRPRPPVQSYSGAHEALLLSESLSRSLKELSRREGATLFMTLLSAFSTLLYRYSGQRDILVGTPIANRNRAETESLIGFFINTLIMRTRFAEQMTFRELLGQVRETALEAYAHQDLPFEKLVEELQPERTMSHSPVFQVMLDLQNAPMCDLELQGLRLTELPFDSRMAKFYLTLTVSETDGRLSALLEYNTDLFDAATVRRMAGHFERLLEAAVSDPDEQVSRLPLLTEDERQQILFEWNDTQAENESALCIHELFERQAAAKPQLVAVVHKDERLTYRELNERANKLAHHLRRLGTGPESLVGVCLERSADAVVAILAVLKAGGAYLPLAVQQPPDRLTFILTDARVKVLLTQEHLLAGMPRQQTQVVICIDKEWSTIEKESFENPRSKVLAGNPAYLIYTSGSTGKPKGVLVSHQNLVHSTFARFRYYNEPLKSFLLLSPFAFDSSVAGLFWTVSEGGMLVIPEEDSHQDPAYLAELIAQHSVSHLLALPGFYELILRQARVGKLTSLRTVIVAGESCSPELVQRHAETLPQTALFNEYGPTEATVWSSAHRCNSRAGQMSVPIGRPVANTQIYVLGPQLEPVPVGVTQEMYIGGDGLARGYLNQPDLTAERFVPNPFSVNPGARLYKTGDLARFLPEGNIQYSGRNDFQVKIRGYRIELGEIESVLAQHPDVREAVVLASDTNGRYKQLTAYVVLNEFGTASAKQLKEFLKERLPEYMLPFSFVVLDAMPLTITGKVDRNALPIDQIGVEATENYLAPRTALEKILAAIFSEILSLERISVNDSFFELGGHSLLATQVLSRVREACQLEVPLRTLFKAPTVAGLAAAILEDERERVECTADLLLKVSNLSDEDVDDLLVARIGSARQGGARAMSCTSKGMFELSGKRRALLEALLNERGINCPTAERIPRRAESGPAPLSFAQQRLWFFDQFEPGNPAYNLVSTVLLQGKLDTLALERSFSEVIRRHEALRTTFDVIEGQPVQIIALPKPLHLRVVDIMRLPEAEREDTVQDLLKQQTSFDLKRGPLLGITLVRLRDREHVLLLAMHHIISDAWSMGVLIGEVGRLYESYATGREVALPALPIQYADFAAWQRQWLQGDVLEEQFAYWRQKLGGSLPVLELPTDRPRPAVQTYNGSSLSFSLSRAVSRSLKSLCKAEGVTLFMTLLAAFKVLLYRYTRQEDLIVGSPIANRQRQELESLIGFFVNTLAMRTDLSGSPTFRELLKRVRETALGAYSNQDLPFESLVEHLQPNRDLSHSPLVQVFFVLENTPQQKLELPGLVLIPLKSDAETAKFDLTLYFDDPGTELQGTLEYNTDLFDRDTIARMAQHLKTLLEGIVVDPSARISELPLLTEIEKRQLLIEWNDTSAEYDQCLCAHHLFDAQVERTPDAVAVAFEDERLSYRELNARANKLAHHLRGLGVVTGDVVGVFMDRSVEMIVGILGLLKAGAACLPLDPSYPSERLAFMLRDAGGPVVLSQRRLAADLPETGARVVCLDADWNDIARGSDEDPETYVTPENWIYVIYTSGSTGTPKAVCMPHRALANLVAWHLRASTRSARTMQFASLNFDVSFQEIFSTLAAGACLLLVRDLMRVDIPALGHLIEENRVERFHLPVLVLQKLAEEFFDKPRTLFSLRELMVGGEQLQITSDTVKLIARLQDCTLYNHYGPSETHVVTSFTLPAHPETWPVFPPLGRPIVNTEMYLLDPHLHPVPVGVPGELYIGGACLAHGYLNRPALTAERFIPHPFSGEPGARLYKTGDLARYRKDGNIEFIGRNDFQVKIRGMRIELGEIEVTLRQHESVSDAVVTLHQDLSGGERKLVAYVIPNRGCTIEPRQLRDHLRGKLPEYMLPSAFVTLAAFPQTSSGKIDRLALPAPEKNLETEEGYIAPRGALEEVLSTIFAEVLKLERIGVLDNFFDLGGHSLSATQIVSRVREAFRTDLPVRRIFEQPTVEGLAQALLEDEGEWIEHTAELLLQVSSFSEEEAGIKLAHQVERGVDEDAISRWREPPAEELVSPETPSLEERTTAIRTAPLSFAQQRLWFLDQYEPNNILYNIPAAIRLNGPLDLMALERSLKEILKRHEALRTTFAMVSDHPVQVLNEVRDFRLLVIELQKTSPEKKEATATRLAAEEARTPFNLAEGPLLRVKVLRLAADDHLLLITMHHIISDGWSIQILMREIRELYEAHANKREAALPDLPIQYADFAVWQRGWLQSERLEEQLSYWRTQLADAPPLLELPTDRPRPTFKTFHGADVRLSFSKSLSENITRLSRREGATLFMTLLSAFSTLLYRYSGQRDILIGTPIANRNRAETESLIGFFINTLIMRTRFAEQMTFRELLGQVRETALEAYARQDLPFEKLVEELQPERTLSHSPVFQVMFHLQNAVTEGLSLCGLSTSPLEVETQTAKFDLLLTMAESKEGLTGRLNYNTNLFDTATVRRMAGHFELLLEAAVSNPDEQLSRLPILSDVEKNTLLFAWNDTGRDYGKATPVHLAFAKQARLTPDAVAARFEEHELTYKELNERANQVARYLRKLGVGPEVLVGIFLDRSIEMLVGLLGILKTGGPYVPLDTQFPAERLSLIIRDAGLSFVLTCEALRESFPVCDVKLVCLDADWQAIDREDSANFDSGVAAENLAYVVYTSGSTGCPKGVLVEHRQLSNYVHGIRERLGLDGCTSFAMVQPLTVDASVTTIYPSLLTGGCLHVMSDDCVADARALATYLRRYQIDYLKLAPSHLAALHQTIDPSKLMPRKLLIIGGEASRVTFSEQLRTLAQCSIFNHYGPTETTVAVTTYQVDETVKDMRSVTLPIGRPLPNVQAYVLDRHMKPLPFGVAGELYIGGKCVSRGYLNSPELTAERFIPDPFSTDTGARLYSTGDVCRYLADGQLEFLGRKDQQVKVRGFRIELGEIETALREHECVREAVLTAYGDTHGDTQLTAYVIPIEGRAPAGGELRAFLKEKLPEYMVPSLYRVLDKLPLTPHGKVDRRALPRLEGAERELDTPIVAPRTAIEEVLSEIFIEVLRVERVGVNDNFFELGGHSLLATQLVSLVRKAFQTDLPLRKIFEAPTVASLTAVLVAGEPSPGQLQRRAETLRRIESLSADDLEELLRRKKAKAPTENREGSLHA
jgi:amino acid adenylation domain-containing protein